MSEVVTGTNRTGLKASPIDAGELMEILELQPTLDPLKDEMDFVPSADQLRLQYLGDAGPVGSMPPPTTLKGVFGTVVQAMSGNHQQVLLDKLGQRAAYERTGTRLYDAALRKLASATLPEGMTLEALAEIRDEEAAHFLLLVESIEKLGGDPTTQTPCADVSGVQGMGLLQVMGDPRTTPSQALETLLAAELIDNASWELLIQLSSGFGLDDMTRQFQSALAAEERHLANVRAWLQAAISKEAMGKAQLDADAGEKRDGIAD
jgi:ferritin-like protein